MTAELEHTRETKLSGLLLISLLLIIALGALLRIYKLGSDSVWLDEAYSIQISHKSLPEIVEETSKDVHPPLYYFALHYWIKLFGDSEFYARLLSALFGTLAILVIYFVGALLFDRATGLLASLLVALSPFNIAFSQEARMYTLFTLLAILVQQVSHVQKGFWIPRPPPRMILDTFITYAGSYWLALVLFPLVALAIFLGLRGRSGDRVGAANATRESVLSSRLKIHLL